MKQVVQLTYPKEAGLEDIEITSTESDLVGGVNGNNRVRHLIEEKSKSKFKGIIKGVKGFAKSVGGVGIAEKSTIESRRSICGGCQYQQGSQCSQCGCFTFHKTRIADEQCPMGYWLRSTTKEDMGCGCGKN